MRHLPHPFGRVTVSMVTPFLADGSLDADGAAWLAARLVDRDGADGILVNTAIGEAPTTTDAEKDALLRAVVDAVGDRAVVVAGVGSGDTLRATRLARAAERAGAHGLLVVPPHFNPPLRQAILHHMRTIATCTDLPVLVCDDPEQAGMELSRATLLRLAEHPRILGVQDCAGDLGKSASVIGESGLSYYSGADELNLPLAAVGAVGCVSTAGNVAVGAVRAVLDAYDAGCVARAAHTNRSLLPLIRALTRTRFPTATTVKALLNHQGVPAGPVRMPLISAGPRLTASLAAVLAEVERAFELPGAGPGAGAAEVLGARSWEVS
ncbi:dihydrodipicolinate synthase family protein [Streptomyces sp. NPDC051907]|uniref:dihydrodipicolinate synthase family protein n=1 Tax=Streptomyces sp. NPDC051907 TaxID=3155284 RepID=UPI00343C5F7E